jgi:hypothetical protein
MLFAVLPTPGSQVKMSPEPLPLPLLPDPEPLPAKGVTMLTLRAAISR